MPDAPAPAALPRAPIPKKVAIGGSLTAVAALALTMAVAGIRPDEGKRNVDYLDIARVPTACYGHTGPDVKVGLRRTDAQCDALLATDVAAKQAGVAACVPALRVRPAVWAASTRMAYNTGVSAFCSSTTADRFNAGAWRNGCDAMLMWNKARVGGNLVVVPGLAARRQRERAQCLTGSVA